ncbi:MAG: hypothetical protein EpisKO_24650 [Epibacterium sp.]
MGNGQDMTLDWGEDWGMARLLCCTHYGAPYHVCPEVKVPQSATLPTAGAMPRKEKPPAPNTIPASGVDLLALGRARWRVSNGHALPRSLRAEPGAKPLSLRSISV